MTDPHLFWTIFAAVLSAIILGGTFFWGAVTYSRLEREGTEKGPDGKLPLIALGLPLAFLILAYFTALN